MKEAEEQVDFLFKDISVRINKSPDQLEPFLKILKENWYDTIDSIRNLTDADYEKMKIPHRIFTAIREQISQQPKNQPPQEKVDTHFKKEVSVKSENKMGNSETKVLNEQFMMALHTELCMKLQNKLKNQHEFNSIMKIIQKIIKNIIKDPYEPKYKLLKRTNAAMQTNLFSHTPCVDFFKGIGFEQTQEGLELRIVEVHYLLFLEEIIEAAFGEGSAKKQPSTSKDEKRFLDITKFPKDQNGIKQVFNEEKLSEMKYCDALEKLIEVRNKMMSDPPKDRRIRIYHKRFEDKNVKVQEISFTEEFEKSDNQIISNYWKQIVANNVKSQKFQSRRKQEFEFLIKQKVHREALIKIKLPNQWIIQGYFGPLETLSKVFEVASDIVIGDIYLFTAPPVKRMDKNMHMTLIELESVPMGSFYLGINNQFYVNAKYTPLIQK